MCLLFLNNGIVLPIQNMTYMLMFFANKAGNKNTKASYVHTMCKIVKLPFEH